MRPLAGPAGNFPGSGVRAKWELAVSSVEGRSLCPKLDLDQLGAAELRPMAWEMGSGGHGTARLS